MTQTEVRKYIEERLDWINSGTMLVDLKKYYDMVDDFQSMLINNPPKELRNE